MVNDKDIVVTIAVILLVIVIVYVIVLFETYKQRTFIFSQYTPPAAPSNSFYPLGSVTPLTQEQIDSRNAIINASLAAN